MVNLFPTQKQKEHPVFGRFCNLYGEALASICHLLSKFEINVLTTEEYCSLPDDVPFISSVENQPIASYIKKDGELAETTKAGIVFNHPVIIAIGLSEDELFAAIAHEIGHILYFFFEYKDSYPGPQGEEVYADEIACRLGLAPQMLSCLEKIEACGICPYSESIFIMRKISIRSFL